MLLYGTLLLLLGCKDTGNTTDAANDAAGTGSPFEAREVSGVRMLTTDFNYDKICNLLEEGFVQGTFELGGLSKMTTTDTPTGCRYAWNEGNVTIAFGGRHPYPSIYHAEYTFNRLYQPKSLPNPSKSGNEPSLFGPAPQGTGAEWPAIGINQPANSSEPVGLTKPAYTTQRAVALQNVGDKALWNPDTQTLHVLYLHHILSIRVDTRNRTAVNQDRAVNIARVIIDRLHEADSDVSEFRPR